MSKRTLRLLGLAALIVLRAPARVPAWAQFSTPYDPDFAPAPQAEPGKKEAAPAGPSTEAPAPEAAPSEEQAPPAPVALPKGVGRFLLLERPDASHIFEVPAPVSTETVKPHTFLEFEQSLPEMKFSQEGWNKAREENFEPPEVTPLIGGPEIAVSTAAPKPPPPEIELPTYGTSLSVTGRKVIGVTFNEKRFINPQVDTGRPQTTTLLDITQQLQLRMQGKVGPKITVNVDYDDTKVNHQDISVVYTGDPDEVVQNVSFGDIDLTLPATEFVSYNKQLFGIRADIKYKGMKASFIGSRTKGTTKSKQFFGNQQFVAEDILDTAYLRRQYYDLTFGNPARLPLRTGSERVFLATQIPGQTNTNTQILTANDLQVPQAASTGTFQLMNSGVDYTVDYTRGILFFRNALQPTFIVAVDFIDASGNSITVEQSSISTVSGPPTCTEPGSTSNGPYLQPGNPCPKLIKTASDVPIIISTEVGYNRELKTFYSMGQQQIVPDNGRGNFILKILDLNRNDVGASLNPIQHYPETLNVDFANGVINLQHPFAVVGDSSTVDPDIYAPTPINKRLIHTEFSYRFKTFFLEPNLVAQSEIVLLNNVKLNRNVDYFIDYDAGFITFFNEDRITPTSEIDISYEVAPFAGITNTSLLGTRVSYDFNKHFSMGSTLLYQAGAKSPTTPSITELAQSLLVIDVDQQFKDIPLGKKLKLKTAAAEIAQSRQDLNLNAFAIIDNMEGIKVEDSVSTLSQQWFISSNPSGTPSRATDLNWITQDIPILTINPRAQANSNQTEKVLSFNYSNIVPGEEVSIVFPFSISGIDFSQRTILEVVMNGDKSNNLLNFHLGSVNEDADGTNGMTLNCDNGSIIFNAPKTNDLHCTGTLTPDDPAGWTYAPTTCFQGGPCPTAVEGVAGKINSEDLNGNGRLDPQDFSGGDFGYMGTPSAANNFTDQTGLFDTNFAVTHTKIDFGGNINDWRTFQIPLNITSATIANWTNVRQIRISIKGAAGGLATGGVNFARIAVVGNTWQPGAATDPAVASSPVGPESMVVTPINNVDNPNYTPIYNAPGDAAQVFSDLYGSLANLQQQSNTNNISEQALEMSFTSMTIVGGVGAVVTTKRLFSKAIDISQHRFFNFLLYGNADPNNVDTKDHTFFLRVGSDTNFFEVRVPLNFTGWRKIQVTQTDSRHNAVADGWVANTPGTLIISSGIPSLQQVAEIVAGVRRTASAAPVTDATQTRGVVYLDEIHMSQPLPRTGNAQKLEVNFEVPGWATFGGKYRSVDRNFQTPTSVVSNQDNRQDTGYLNYTKLSYFPMSFNLSRVLTDTPNTAQTGQLSNTVNLLQSGLVTNWTGSAQGRFSLGAYPHVNLSYTRNVIDYDLLARNDDRKTYSGTLTYGVPGGSHVLPKTIDTNYSWSKYDVRFNSLASQQIAGNFNTSELTQTLGSKLTFVPWTGSSFNPSYSLTKINEHRDDNTGPVEQTSEYPKSMHETVGFSSNYRVLPWLNPQVNYSVDILENNILNVSTFIVNSSTYVFQVGDIKTVNRNSNGSVSLPITIGDIFHRTKLFRSLNIVSGYQLQDGDVWNQVERQLDTAGALWIRTPLHPQDPAAQLQNQTLRDTVNSTQRWSPLEAYDIRGRKSAFKTLSLSNNFVESIQRQNVTGTQSKTISVTFPDLVASISQLEKLWFTERWMNSTQMNFKYSAHRINNIGQTLSTDHAFSTDLRSIIIKRFDSLISFNLRDSTNENLVVEANTQQTAHQDATVQTTFDIKKFRFTPKTDYSHDATKLGTGVRTQDDTVITPSMLVRGDLALPRGLLLPGTTKPILFSNRIIWTTALSFALHRSPVTQANNFKLGTLNTSADYELAKNLRMALNGSFSREWHDFLPEEDFISYSFGTTLTFQF